MSFDFSFRISWYQVGRKKYITSNYIQIEYPEDDE